jgi:hypothetical protein
MSEKIKIFKEEDLKNGLYRVEKRELNNRIFANLLVKGGYYVTIGGIDIEITKRAYSELEDGEQVCVFFPDVYCERKGRPILLKELRK